MTSEYPWVNKYGTYPVGHPTILFEPEDQDPSHYYGIVKVDILPPFGLYNPVLPHRHKGKLSFPLCRTCVEEQSALRMLEQSYCCTHTESQRMLRGT